MKIAIAGRKKDTGNYEKYIMSGNFEALTTLNLGELAGFDGLLLPGGGDITPGFFGECNNGSRQIDTELDILQFTALDYAIRRHMPVFGICKGMQLINVAFGGTITQHLDTADLHQYQNGDQYHDTLLSESCCLYPLYGTRARVNSAHHQGIHLLGKELKAIQWCEADGCIEAIIHEYLPILGLQWHPERLDPAQTALDGALLLSLFSFWIEAFRAGRTFYAAAWNEPPAPPSHGPS